MPRCTAGTIANSPARWRRLSIIAQSPTGSGAGSPTWDEIIELACTRRVSAHVSWQCASRTGRVLRLGTLSVLAAEGTRSDHSPASVVIRTASEFRTRLRCPSRRCRGRRRMSRLLPDANRYRSRPSRHQRAKASPMPWFSGSRGFSPVWSSETSRGAICVSTTAGVRSSTVPVQPPPSALLSAT